MKKWLRKILGITELEERNSRLSNRLNILAREVIDLKELNKKIIEQNDFIMKQFNISAGINHYENHSWAVISIQGKPEYVKFVNLSNQDMRSVHSFLKQFERTNRTIDSPLQFLKFR